MQCGPTDKLLQAAVLPWGGIIVDLATEPNKVVGAIHPKLHPHTVEEIDTWMSAPAKETHEGRPRHETLVIDVLIGAFTLHLPRA
jgi:hypothetical protein